MFNLENTNATINAEQCCVQMMNPFSCPGLSQRALSFCVEKPVVPVGNQMERSFSPPIFRKKGIPLFSVLPEKPPYHLRLHTGIMLPDEIRGLSVKKCPVPFGGKFSTGFPYKWKALLPFDFVKKLHCSIGQPSLVLCLVVAGRFGALKSPRAMSAGAYAPGRFNHAELVYGRGARLNSALALQVGGLSEGPTTLPSKKHHVTETSLGNTSHCLPGGLRHCSASTNGPFENQLGTHARKASLLDAKTHLIIGTWNVRTLFDTSRTTQVIREMQSYKPHILGVSECRWTGFGQLAIGTGETILYAGRNDGQHMAGVARILKNRCGESTDRVKD